MRAMTDSASAPPDHYDRASRRALTDPPGGVLMWIVFTLELITFSIIFVMLGSFRSGEAAVFEAGQRALDPTFGLVLTVTLLTSGWLVAEGVHAHRVDDVDRARRYFAGGIAIGLAFVGLKVFDFVSKSSAGLGLDGDFGTAYFLATGFHFVHVVIGLSMLVWVAARMGRKPFEDAETSVAGTALFWHMCDIAWLFLFPLFYVR
jgi:nitric oxide reductase NorE protein